MKSLKTMLFLCSAVLLLSANCHKKNKVYQVLKGRIMQDCTTPYANKIVKLKGSNGYSPSFCEDENGNKEFYTDANGYFEIRFKRNGSKVNLYAKYEVMMDITINESPMLDIGEVNIGGTVNFVIKLDVKKSYTENDTLFYSNWSYPHSTDIALKLAGPFATGVIDTALNVTYSKVQIYGKTPHLNLTYYINNVEDNTIYFDTPLCNNTFGEVIFVIN